VRTVGAVAAYLVVFAAMGYPLIQTANETARDFQKPAPQAGDTNRQASDSLSTFIQRASDYARVDMISRSNDKAIEIKGNDAALFNDRGALYEELGGYDQAIELNPNYALAFSNRCSAQYKKDYQIAINDCGRAIRLDQSGVSAYIVRGDASPSAERRRRAKRL
jgi:tetratricopeptide (TPR) repeat protein